MTVSHGKEAEKFSIIIVCTGNVCRSPFAEHYLRARLPTDDLTITSVGTNVNHDLLVPDEIQRIGSTYGLDLSAHRPRSIQPAYIAEGNLILTLTALHRRQVVRLHPLASRYTFTLREFAWMITNSQPRHYDTGAPQHGAKVSLITLVESMASRRGTIAPAPEGIDIVDPFGKKLHAYRRAVEDMVAAVDVIFPEIASIIQQNTTNTND